jgi:hypothetical protein
MHFVTRISTAAKDRKEAEEKKNNFQSPDRKRITN